MKVEKNLEEISSKIEKFIRDSVERFNKKGIIIGLSGGIDSAVVSFLSVRALGKDRVFGLIMPDKESTPENIKDAKEIANLLAIEHKEIDLTPLLTEIGVYNLIPFKIGKNKFLLNQALKLFKKRMKINMIHSLGILGVTTPNKIFQRANAVILPKLRLRSLLLYYIGTLKNLLVAGTTNKTEYLLGHYDKYGDGACDIEPIRGLYKTQVKELAKFLGVAGKIIEKPASHDLFAGSILTDEVLMGMNFERVDSILIGLEEGKENKKLAEELGVEIKIIEEVKMAIANEKIKREMPFLPDV